jgi:hypothetical protein
MYNGRDLGFWEGRVTKSIKKQISLRKFQGSILVFMKHTMPYKILLAKLIQLA